ncbi:uncharacterized protein G2W53_010534 [Senna tora]|uniref:Uncharacterized protein n=1 Tax=Senna tora TaxID=362788 RepID=A0A834X0X9_9FABA|nr:uncharacterized protein G2W53_010534 [Senna tora]
MEYEAFLEWKKIKKEEKYKEEFELWKKLKEKGKAVIEEQIKSSTKTLESKIADYLENSSIDEEIEEEIITKTKMMTLEKEPDDESLEKE